MTEIEEEKQVRLRYDQTRWIILLLSAGIILVCASEGIGKLFVETCGGAGCSWNPDDVQRAAETVRCVGAMAFVAGLAERIVMAIQSTRH